MHLRADDGTLLSLPGAPLDGRGRSGGAATPRPTPAGPCSTSAAGPAVISSRCASSACSRSGSTSPRRSSRSRAARGVNVLERSVFAGVPGQGRWRSVLLLDGNIGIGGDPRPRCSPAWASWRATVRSCSWRSSPRTATTPCSACAPRRTTGTDPGSAGPRSGPVGSSRRRGPPGGRRRTRIDTDDRCFVQLVRVVKPAHPAVHQSPCTTSAPRRSSASRSAVAFTTCFVTGLLSHVAQDPHPWFPWPARPAGLYRVTQGLHVATGLAAIPLLLAKLWTVFPQLFQRPAVRSVAHGDGAPRDRPARRRFALHALHRLRATSTSGIRGRSTSARPTTRWRGSRSARSSCTSAPSGRSPAARSRARSPALARALAPDAGGGDARRAARSSGRSAGAAAGVTLLTVGQTVWPLRKLALLAPRRPDAGPQGFPVNRTARAAGRGDAPPPIPTFRLTVTGAVDPALSFSLAELRDLPQHEATLPIACVEGWSASRDVARGAGARSPRARRGPRRRHGTGGVAPTPARRTASSQLTAAQASDGDTLLALAVDGEELHLDHGFPVRLVAPNRPGVEQTKWVTRLVVR